MGLIVHIVAETRSCAFTIRRVNGAHTYGAAANVQSCDSAGWRCASARSRVWWACSHIHMRPAAADTKFRQSGRKRKSSWSASSVGRVWVLHLQTQALLLQRERNIRARISATPSVCRRAPHDQMPLSVSVAMQKQQQENNWPKTDNDECAPESFPETYRVRNFALRFPFALRSTQSTRQSSWLAGLARRRYIAYCRMAFKGICDDWAPQNAEEVKW